MVYFLTESTYEEVKKFKRGLNLFKYQSSLLFKSSLLRFSTNVIEKEDQLKVEIKRPKKLFCLPPL
jgi:hypothetical protein